MSSESAEAYFIYTSILQEERELATKSDRTEELALDIKDGSISEYTRLLDIDMHINSSTWQGAAQTAYLEITDKVSRYGDIASATIYFNMASVHTSLENLGDLHT